MSNEIKPNNPELVIRKLNPAITIFSLPFARGGMIPFGGRSTAITLQNGDVWLAASHPLDEQTLSTIQAMGTVRYIIAFDREHTMSTHQYARAFPDAKLYVPKGARDGFAKAGSGKEDLVGRINHVFGEGKGDPFDALTNGEIKSADFGGAHANEDVAFLHTPSKTLIQADLLFNLPPKEQYSKSKSNGTAFFVTKALAPGTAHHQRMLWYMISKDKKLMAEQARLVNSWDFDRIIPCHGDVIETGGKSAWSSTFNWFINGKN